MQGEEGRHMDRQSSTAYGSTKRKQVQIKVSRISLILQSYRLRQIDLARMADLSVGTVNRTIQCLKSGDLRNKSDRRNAKLVSVALNLSPEILTGYTVVILIAPNSIGYSGRSASIQGDAKYGLKFNN
jgi:hypothetical protein